MVYILVGISASGKTTWTNNFLKDNPNSIIISRDILREKYYPNNKIKRILPFQEEEKITSYEVKSVLKNFFLGKDIIIDDTNLRIKYLKEWIGILNCIKAKWEIKIFDIDLNIAIERDKNREFPIKEEVIKKQYLIFKSNKKEIELLASKTTNDSKYTLDKDLLPKIDFPVFNVLPYFKNEKLPLAVIVDVDGTIALTGDRSIFDYSKVDIDIPRIDVIRIIKSLKEQNIKIIIFSGRKLEAKEKTIQWLKNNLIPFDEIYLRNEEESNNNCSDTVAKYRMFNQIRDKYNFIGTFDDRPKVTRLYQELGLTTFFVGEYGREF